MDEEKKGIWDSYGGNVLWLPVIALTGMGILFVYSASSVYSSQHFGDEFYFARKQALFLIPALISAFLGAKIPLEMYYRFIKPLFLILVVLTFATHLPHIGRRVSGAARWLNIGPFPIQPSEFLKIFTLIYFTNMLLRPQEKIPSQESKGSLHARPSFFKKHQKWIEAFCLILSPIAVIAQKDLGTTIVIISGCLAILFIHGLAVRYFAILFGFLSMGLIAAVLIEPYRIARIMTFVNPFKDPLGAGFQVIQSFVAVANGGLFGKGIGESQQKLFFLPEAHTDFILAVITEEMGFIGIVVLVLLYSVVYYAILRLVIYAITPRERLLAAGCFAMLVVTTIINMGVVAGALPTKGLPLPFISNGGSALIANYFIVGFMAQISRRIHSVTEQHDKV